jgi:hypothetical protein
MNFSMVVGVLQYAKLKNNFVINPPFYEIEEEMDSIWSLDRSRAIGSPATTWCTPCTCRLH